MDKVLPPPAYVMSEPHLSGHRVVLGYEDLKDAQQAHEYLASRTPPPDYEVNPVGTMEALKWYGEQARLCRLIHSEGDAGRHALSDDGGKRAAAIIKKGEADG